MVLELGPSTWGARIDIKHTFQNLPIHPDDLHLLGFTLGGKHYINSNLPFGAASSCTIFEKVASTYTMDNHKQNRLSPNFTLSG